MARLDPVSKPPRFRSQRPTIQPRHWLLRLPTPIHKISHQLDVHSIHRRPNHHSRSPLPKWRNTHQHTWRSRHCPSQRAPLSPLGNPCLNQSSRLLVPTLLTKLLRPWRSRRSQLHRCQRPTTSNQTPNTYLHSSSDPTDHQHLATRMGTPSRRSRTMGFCNDRNRKHIPSHIPTIRRGTIRILPRSSIH